MSTSGEREASKEQRPTARSRTKSVGIERPPAAVFAYLADPANWPQWAVVNALAVSPRPGEAWWDMTTPTGPAALRLRPDAATGILDHDFIAAEASWTVPARVVPNGDGAEFLMTFFQPPQFTDDFFDAQNALVDTELGRLKEILEAAAGEAV